jgi:hypothetical protein
MAAVPIKDCEQYIKAIGVLTRVGGTYHGVGRKERFLLVTEAQYQALVEAKVIPPGGDENPRQSKTAKS